MVHTHEVLNGEKCLYSTANLFVYGDGPLKEQVYTSEQLLSSLADGSTRRFRFNRSGEFTVTLDGYVVGAHRATPTAWVLTVNGDLIRPSGDDVLRAPVTIVCLYETGDYGGARGFGLIPSLALARLWL
jgi:hypothetical protein